MTQLKETVDGVLNLGLTVKTADGILAKGAKVKISGDLEVEAVDAAQDHVLGYVAVANRETSGKCTVTTRGKRMGLETTGAAYSAGDFLGLDAAGKFVKATSANASGTITVNDFTWDGGETVTVNGVVLTEGTDFSAATSTAVTALNLATAINNKVLGVKASAAAAIVTVQALASGQSGNGIAMSTNDASNADVTVNNAVLAGGRDFYPVGLALEASTGADQSKHVLWF